MRSVSCCLYHFVVLVLSLSLEQWEPRGLGLAFGAGGGAQGLQNCESAAVSVSTGDASHRCLLNTYHVLGVLGCRMGKVPAPGSLCSSQLDTA